MMSSVYFYIIAYALHLNERKFISIKISKINKVFAAIVPFSNKDASTTLGKAIVTLSEDLKNES